MLFWIVTVIMGMADAQIAGQIQQPTANQNNQNVQRDTGSTNYEEYTDSDGNVKRRAFKYGFQYSESYKPAKPVGQTQKESYTTGSGELSERSFKYAHQYTGDEGSPAPIKLKAQKTTPPSEGSNSYPTSSPSSSSSSSSPSSTPSSTADAKERDADVMNKMRELIKERQQLKAGASK